MHYLNKSNTEKSTGLNTAEQRTGLPGQAQKVITSDNVEMCKRLIGRSSRVLGVAAIDRNGRKPGWTFQKDYCNTLG